MTAAEKTETEYDIVPNFNGRIIKFKFTSGDTSDWVIFNNPIGAVKAILITGGDNATTYATGSGANIASATATTLTDGTFTAEQRPASGYIRMAGGEIIKYSGATKSSATGTLTIDERGCFGTTAASATTEACYVLNTIIFALTTVGAVRGIAEIIDE